MIDDMRTEIHHVDDIPWHEAPAPPRLHRHVKQTWGWLNWVEYVERCACGAIGDGRRWTLLDPPRKADSTVVRVARHYGLIRR